MEQHVEERLMSYLQKQSRPFSIDSVLRRLDEPVSRQNREDLADYLRGSLLAFPEEPYNPETLWISRPALFTGKKIRIKPTRTEIAAGILIPGSRLVPFINPSLLPHEFVFSFQGKPLDRTLVEVSRSDCYPLYRFYGEEYASQFLACDNSENPTLFADIDAGDPDQFWIAGVDLKDTYWAEGFKSGDYVEVTILDWRVGLCDLSFVASEFVNQDTHKEWYAALERALHQSFSEFGPGMTIDDQLVYAWFVGREELFSLAPAPMDDFFSVVESVEIVPYGVETRLWFRDGEIPSPSTWAMDGFVTPMNLVDDAYAHLGLPVNGRIVDACIYDSLYRREGDYSAILERLVPFTNHSAAFCIPVIERALQNRYEHLAPDYNVFVDHEGALLRHRTVNLYHALVKLFHTLSVSHVSPDQVSDQGAVVLTQIMNHTISTLEALSSSSAGDSALLEPMWASLEGMEESFFEIKTGIQEELPDLLKRRFSLLDDSEDDDE